MVWWTRRHTGADAILITRQRDSSRKEQEDEKKGVEVEEEKEKRRTLPSHLPFCWAKSWLLQWHTQRKKRQHVRGGENATKFLQNISAEKLLTALPTFWRNDWLFFNPSEAAAADVRCQQWGLTPNEAPCSLTHCCSSPSYYFTATLFTFKGNWSWGRMPSFSGRVEEEMEW